MSDEYSVDEKQAKEYGKAVYMAAIGIFASGFSGFILGVNLTGSINYILTGDADTPSAESQVWVNACLGARQVLSLSMAEFWAQGGSCWGRKRVLLVLQLTLVFASLSSTAAAGLKLVAVHVVANVFLGLGAVIPATVLTFSADVSTVGRFSSNVGTLTMSGALGVIVGMSVFISALSDVLVYAVPALFLVASMALWAYQLPDASPPLGKRSPPSMTALGWALVPCSILRTLTKQTHYTKCLLICTVFGGASYKTIEIWLFNYALVVFSFDRTTCGLWILSVFLSGGLFTVTATRWVVPKRTCNALMWVTPLFALWVSMGPPEEYSMWVGVVLLLPNSLLAACLNALFFGQLGPCRRGELAALNSIAEKVGGLLALAVAGPLTVAWLRDHEENGPGGIPPPTLLQALFEVSGGLAYYIGFFFFRHQDNYDGTFLHVEGSPEADAPPPPPAAPPTAGTERPPAAEGLQLGGSQDAPEADPPLNVKV